MANLTVTARDLDNDRLAEGRVSPAGRRVMRVTTHGGEARVRLRKPSGTWKIGLLPGQLNRFEIDLTRDLPLRLDLDLLLTDGRIDLARAPVSRIALDGALNDLTLRLGAPESNVRINLNGTFNHIVLEGPPGTPVRGGCAARSAGRAAPTARSRCTSTANGCRSCRVSTPPGCA